MKTVGELPKFPDRRVSFFLFLSKMNEIKPTILNYKSLYINV